MTPTSSYNTTTTVSSGSAAGIFIIYVIFLIVLLFLIIIPLWKVYKKCGKPGWAAIIPIYNNWVLFEIVGYPGWWAILSIVPIVTIFPAIMAFVSYFKLAKLFGKGTGFAVCTVIFPYVCIPILGFGSAQPIGQGPVASPPAGNMPPQTPAQPPAPQAPVSPPTPGPTPPMPPVQSAPPQAPASPDSSQSAPPTGGNIVG